MSLMEAETMPRDPKTSLLRRLPRSLSSSSASCLIVAWFLTVGCGGGEAPLVVGSKNFSEQVLLGEIVSQMLEAEGVPVQRRLNLGGSFICHNAMVSGNMDVYIEYTGTALTAILDEETVHDPALAYERVQTLYRDQFGLEWSEPLGFNNTFALAMQTARSEELSIRTISDLASHADSIRVGAGHEFLERPDGYPGLIEAYGLQIGIEPRGMELGLIYQAVSEGEVDVVAGNSTDGLIDKMNLVVLEDDRNFFPPYDAAAVYRPDAVARVPALERVLGRLEGAIDEPTMRRLNREVDSERRSTREVAEEFLKERGWVN